MYRKKDDAKAVAEEAFLKKIEEIYSLQKVFDEEDEISLPHDASQHKVKSTVKAVADSNPVERFINTLKNSVPSFYNEESSSYITDNGQSKCTKFKDSRML